MLRAGTKGPTTPERHQLNNDLQLVYFKRDQPAQFAKLLERSTPEERAAIEKRVKRAEEHLT